MSTLRNHKEIASFKKKISQYGCGMTLVGGKGGAILKFFSNAKSKFHEFKCIIQVKQTYPRVLDTGQ
jgi:hypothetical protein